MLTLKSFYAQKCSRPRLRRTLRLDGGDRFPTDSLDRSADRPPRSPTTRRRSTRARAGSGAYRHRPGVGLDAGGDPLQDRLDVIGQTGQSYLEWIWFVDGGSGGRCAGSGISAFTSPGSQVVHFCGDRFTRALERKGDRIPRHGRDSRRAALPRPGREPAFESGNHAPCRITLWILSFSVERKSGDLAATGGEN